MQVQLVSVDIEVKKPGAKGWSMANVKYLKDGETKWQNVVSFANPQVYSAVQRYVGETVEVTVTKNAKNYDEWADVKQVSSGSTGGNTAAGVSASTAGNTGQGATRVTGSNYETAVERARRQVLIVKQSSLTAALTLLTNTKKDGDFTADDVMDYAQIFADWVFDEDKEDTNV